MADPNLRVRFSADLSGFRAGLVAVRGDVRDFASGMGGLGNQLNGFFGKFTNVASVAGAAIAGVAAAATGAATAIKGAIDRADEMGDAATSIGISTEALSKFAFAAGFSGVQLDQLKSGLVLFEKGLLANEKKMNALGVATRDAAGNFLPIEQRILNVAGLFAKLPDSMERVRVATEWFGKSGADLIPFLVSGRDGLEEFGKQAEATGNVITSQAAKAAGEFNDNLDVLKSTLMGAANVAAQEVIPAFSNYAKEAANGAMKGGAAAEAGRALATVFKLVAAGAIIVKNAIEAQVNILAFLIDAAIGAGKALSVNLGGAFSVLSRTWTALKDDGPLAALKAYRDGMTAFATHELKEVAALPGRLRAGFNAMRDGVTESQQDIAAVGKLFSAAEGEAGKLGKTAGAAGTEVAATTAEGKRLQELIRQLFGDKEKSGKSGAEKKAEQLRKELERLNKEIERSIEKLREDEIKKEEEFRKQVDDAINEHLRESGRSAEAAANEIEAQYRELANRLRNNGDLANALKVEELIDLKKLRAQLEQFGGEAQSILGHLGAGESALAPDVMMGSVEAERQLHDLRAGSLQQLEQMRAAVAAYYDETQNPEVLRFLQELDTSINQVQVSQHQLAVTIAGQAADALTGFFTDLATGAKSFKDAFWDMVRNFVAGMAQIAARALATFLVLQLLDAIYPGLGRATAATMQAGVMHGGGIAGQGGTVRSGLSPMLFGAAPRYHGGGIAGLAPDEVPAVLRKGEEILTEDNPRHRNNAGAGGRALVKQPIVAIGDRAVADALAGTAGEDVIITHVRNNWEALTRGG